MAPSKPTKGSPKTTAKKEKVCHPSSRKASQLVRTALRKSKMGDRASKRAKKEDSQLDVFNFFYHAIPESGVLSLEDMHTIIKDVWLPRFDEELEAERAARRKGRPKSTKEMKLEEIKLREEENYRAGIEVPDLTDESTVEIFRRWDQKEVAFIQLLRFIRISSADTTVAIVSRPGKHASIHAAHPTPPSLDNDLDDMDVVPELLPPPPERNGAAKGAEEEDTQLPGALSSTDIQRFNRPPIHKLLPWQEAKLAEVVQATLSEISQFLDPTESNEERGLIERLRDLREDIDITGRDVDTARTSIVGLTGDINEIHPRLQSKLIDAVETLAPTVNKERVAEADLQASSIELSLMKLAYLRTRALHALYGVTVDTRGAPASPVRSMPEALKAAYGKLQAEAGRMEREEREVDRQLGEYEQTLGLVDSAGSGGFSQVIEDWARVKRDTEECQRDLRRFGWTGD
ncbi:hypothetical protein EYR40_008755 [Pleurotus pulmonarius]|nr:hypothetical protein EYR36_009576 [Pleurotus pulmonarius]KAF4593957.1 hypothetical protein EYR40_008755 [Pleurotus pulmonarius]